MRIRAPSGKQSPPASFGVGSVRLVEADDVNDRTRSLPECVEQAADSWKYGGGPRDRERAVIQEDALGVDRDQRRSVELRGSPAQFGYLSKFIA
jgi:hypothetical protein